MMYSNHFAAAIKVGGKVLRESSGEVTLPFNTEYSLLLKNINSVKAKARVFIDGEDVTDGWLVLEPNSKLNLERFIRNGNLQSGNKFKFIERTEKVEEHRGSNIDDGLIRVEFKFAKKRIEVPEIHHYPVYEPWHVPYPRPWPYWGYPYWSTTLTSTTDCIQNSQYTVTTSSLSESQGAAQNQMQASCMNVSNVSMANPEGITVEGGISDQQFYNTYDFDTESASHVIVLRLKGRVGDEEVKTAVTVDQKTKCKTCGRINKGGKFCSECGTSLQIV